MLVFKDEKDRLTKIIRFSLGTLIQTEIFLFIIMIIHP
jgi:hypothetical protein